VSALVAASPELKRLWIRVLKRVHPDLAVDEQDRRRCERLTQQANDAFARRDEAALRAVLEPKGPLPPRPAPPDAWEIRAEGQQAAPPQSTYQPPLVPQRPPSVIGREALGLLWAACAVLCLLIYGIFQALSEKVGRSTSLFFLVLLAATVLWLITKNSNWSYEHKTRWVAAVASGMILVGICLLNSHPRANPLIPSARAATAVGSADPVEWKNSDNLHLSPSSPKAHPPQGNTLQQTIVMPPSPERVKRLGLQLDGYIEAAKNKVAQKWNSSEVAGSIPAGATVYIQFAIRRRGNHEVPTMETSSGYSSLDASCLRAVDRIRTFDHLPRSYNGDSLTVLYHCTYPGSPTTKVAQDSTLPPVQQAPNNGSVDGVHRVQQPTNDTVVHN
jgi:TonB C terminal